MSVANAVSNGARNAASHLETIVEAYDAYYALMHGAEEVEVDGETYESDEEIMELMQEMPLSIETRRGWTALGTEGAAIPIEYRILLSTGGPALRLAGTLGAYCEPDGAVLEHQDWFTPWTEYHAKADERDALIWFASLFYFGE